MIGLNSLVKNRTLDDWGDQQVYEIETAFECSTDFYGSEDAEDFGQRFVRPKQRLIAIMQNIIDNNGEFRP